MSAQDKITYFIKLTEKIDKKHQEAYKEMVELYRYKYYKVPLHIVYKELMNNEYIFLIYQYNKYGKVCSDYSDIIHLKKENINLQNILENIKLPFYTYFDNMLISDIENSEQLILDLNR